MKKILITALSIVTLGGVLRAQSVAQGVSDWYAERFLGAKATFEKLQAANPNDIQATYWLGQTYIEMRDIPAARGVYEKGLASSANAPLLEVGMGQVELEENKINEARQRFEKAVTATSGKKGGDPEILNAVGRAIANTYTDQDKRGDINFAVTKLQEAADSKTKDNALLADIYVNLGNALRLQKPGENGGVAFSAYQKSFEANPNFPVAYYRLAKLFNTQHNVELYEKYLTDAITKDPRFAPAYYDLAYLKMGRDLAAAENYAKLFAQNADPDPQNEYLTYSLLWAQKKYDDAIRGAESIKSRLGDKTKPRVEKLIANSKVSKGDTVGAKPNIDAYFAKVKPDDPEYVPKDWVLKATIYSAFPGEEAVVLNSFQEGIKMDTVLENKLEIIKAGTKFFADKKQYDKEAIMWETLLQVKPNPTINDYFAANVANYRTKTYEGYVKGYNYSKIITEKWADQPFGWEWQMNNAILVDTVKKDSILVPAALALLEFAKKDTVKYMKQIYNAASQLAVYYNEKEENDKAIEYLQLMKRSTTDPAIQARIDDNIRTLSAPRQPARATNPPRTSNTGPAKKPEGGTN